MNRQAIRNTIQSIRDENKTFDIGHWFSEIDRNDGSAPDWVSCGTPGCIAGHALSAAGIKRSYDPFRDAMNLLDIETSVAYSLFIPTHIGNNISAIEAAYVLELMLRDQLTHSLGAGIVVDWDRAMDLAWIERTWRARRNKWVSTLRSGKYSQARGNLRSKEEDAFCCLGVYCQLRDPNDWFDDIAYNSPDHTAHLSANVRAFMGLATKDGSFVLDSLPSPLRLRIGPDMRRRKPCLAALNDSGFTFGLIAEVIEQEPEGLFATPFEYSRAEVDYYQNGKPHKDFA